MRPFLFSRRRVQDRKFFVQLRCKIRTTNDLITHLGVGKHYINKMLACAKFLLVFYIVQLHEDLIIVCLGN